MTVGHLVTPLGSAGYPTSPGLEARSSTTTRSSDPLVGVSRPGKARHRSLAKPKRSPWLIYGADFQRRVERLGIRQVVIAPRAPRYAEDVFRAEGVTLAIRIGLNSGEVVVRSLGSDLRMDYSAVGQTTDLAARKEQMARPGTVLLTPETLALAEGFVQVTSRGPVPVKG